jgi:TatD DNase family protein
LAFLIDSHCHLDDERLIGEETGVLQRCHEAGVKICVTIGTDEKTSAGAAALAARHPGVVFHTVGAHPNDADRFTEANLLEIERLAHETHPKAIGEVGLDYYHAADHAKQKALFSRMIKLARELSLPLVIHDRDAHEDIYEQLTAEARGMKILMHCYSAGVAYVEKFLSLNCYFSVAGPVTFKNGQDVRDTVALITLDRLVVETDAPYLTPEPHRGKRNEPSYVKFTAMKVAEVKGILFEDLVSQTTETAHRFFNL